MVRNNRTVTIVTGSRASLVTVTLPHTPIGLNVQDIELSFIVQCKATLHLEAHLEHPEHRNIEAAHVTLPPSNYVTTWVHSTSGYTENVHYVRPKGSSHPTGCMSGTRAVQSWDCIMGIFCPRFDPSRLENTLTSISCCSLSKLLYLGQRLTTQKIILLYCVYLPIYQTFNDARRSRPIPLSSEGPRREFYERALERS